MKTFSLALLTLAILAPTAHASSDQESDQECIQESRAFLANKLKVRDSKISFYNGALLGDGANALQVSLFQVRGKSGLYKLELDAEDCTLRNIELIDN